MKPFLFALAVITLSASMQNNVQAADAPSVNARSLTRSSTPTDAPYSQSTLVMITNRARTLGNQASAARTRYFVATDADLRGKTPEETLQRLTPAEIRPGDHVRTLEVLIDLKRPVTVRPEAGQTANIGTAIVEAAIGGAVRRLDVRRQHHQGERIASVGGQIHQAAFVDHIALRRRRSVDQGGCVRVRVDRRPVVGPLIRRGRSRLRR